MKKRKLILIVMLFVMNNALIASVKLPAAKADTLSGEDQISILRAMSGLHPWLSYEVDYNWKPALQPIRTETRSFFMSNGRYAIETPGIKVKQNYSFNFSVDTLAKTIVTAERNSSFTMMMFFDFEDLKIREYDVQRTYAIDSSSLRKLVVDFKQSSMWEKYIVVYDPADFLPKQIRITMKATNSEGQRSDMEFVIDFRNYQTTPFDESVFSNDPWFKNEQGVLVLTEAYSHYKLITYPVGNK